MIRTIATATLRRSFAAAVFVALAGCGALPVLSPDMARADPGSVQFKAASGRILSSERSRAIVDRLGGDGQAPDPLARHLAIEEEVAGSPLVLGNRVALLEDGERTYAAMFKAIDAARDTINVETYILEEDDVGMRFADALIARQAAGVQVNLIHDGFGTLSTSKAFFKRLADAGIQVVEFNPVNPLAVGIRWDVNERDHRKLLVVDGTTAVLGGINISGVYSIGSSGSAAFGGSGGSAGSGGGESGGRKGGGDRKHDLPWRDTDLLVEGPVVADFQRLFMQTWEKQTGAPLAGRAYFPQITPAGAAVVRAIGSTPDEPFSRIYVTLISAINCAESEVWLTNAYFVPDPQLMQALIGAVARGVDVKLIVPSVTDSSLVFHAGRARYDALLEGGVKLYERRSALLHAKTAVIDGVWSTIGSTNLDWRSFLHNQELTAVVLGADFGATMRTAFERDLAESQPIALESWRSRPISTRMKEAFARVWEYWL